MGRRGFDDRPFNIVAIAKEGASAKAIASLSSLGTFRATPYRRVLVGAIQGEASSAVTDAWRRDASAFEHVGRLTPLERVVPFERDDVTEALCCALQDVGQRLAGRSFHVRARLRGLSGRLEAQAVERALGGFVIDRAAETGAVATVSFTEPDYVVAVEVVAKRVGYALLDRALRSLPIVRPR